VDEERTEKKRRRKKNDDCSCGEKERHRVLRTKAGRYRYILGEGREWEERRESRLADEVDAGKDVRNGGKLRTVAARRTCQRILEESGKVKNAPDGVVVELEERKGDEFHVLGDGEDFWTRKTVSFGLTEERCAAYGVREAGRGTRS